MISAGTLYALARRSSFFPLICDPKVTMLTLYWKAICDLAGHITNNFKVLHFPGGYGVKTEIGIVKKLGLVIYCYFDLFLEAFSSRPDRSKRRSNSCNTSRGVIFKWLNITIV